MGDGMADAQVWALVAVVALGFLVGMALRRFRTGTRSLLTPLEGMGITLILAGFFFYTERWLGYGLITAGVLLAVVDAVRRSRG